MYSVLLIEDSAEDQALVRKALEGVAVVSCVETRERALELLYRRDFDMVILDLYLPDADGFELLETIRSNPKWRNLPLLILSVRSEVAEKVRGFSKGADDYVVKPFHPLELAARVRSKTPSKSCAASPRATIAR
jgi:DNA-binding response OmpR family regulator